MEESKEVVKEEKSKCCCCSKLLGVAVIVFAWWNVSWAPIALTVLGAIIILKELIGSCACRLPKKSW